MMAVTSREETGSALLERSRFAYPETDYTAETSCPENLVPGEKTAPRIFLREELETRPESLPQMLGTHQENTVFFGTIVLGCAVAPNSGGSNIDVIPANFFSKQAYTETDRYLKEFWFKDNSAALAEAKGRWEGAVDADNWWARFKYFGLYLNELTTGGIGPMQAAFLVPGNSKISLFRGSGPAAGVIEVSDLRNSVGAMLNYNPGAPIEYIFDTESERFLVGKPQTRWPGYSPHENLASLAGSKGSTVVGGMFGRGVNGEFIFDEFSGHFHQNWNDVTRAQFIEFMEQNLKRGITFRSGF